MEAKQSETLQTSEWDLDRKVVIQIKKFTDNVQKSSLLLATSLFGGSKMDGGLMTLTVDNLVKQG